MKNPIILWDAPAEARSVPRAELVHRALILALKSRNIGPSICPIFVVLGVATRTSTDMAADLLLTVWTLVWKFSARVVMLREQHGVRLVESNTVVLLRYGRTEADLVTSDLLLFHFLRQLGVARCVVSLCTGSFRSIREGSPGATCVGKNQTHRERCLIQCLYSDLPRCQGRGSAVLIENRVLHSLLLPAEVATCAWFGARVLQAPSKHDVREQSCMLALCIARRVGVLPLVW